MTIHIHLLVKSSTSTVANALALVFIDNLKHRIPQGGWTAEIGPSEKEKSVSIDVYIDPHYNWLRRQSRRYALKRLIKSPRWVNNVSIEYEV